MQQLSFSIVTNCPKNNHASCIRRTCAYLYSMYVYPVVRVFCFAVDSNIWSVSEYRDKAKPHKKQYETQTSNLKASFLLFQGSTVTHGHTFITFRIFDDRKSQRHHQKHQKPTKKTAQKCFICGSLEHLHCCCCFALKPVSQQASVPEKRESKQEHTLASRQLINGQGSLRKSGKADLFVTSSGAALCWHTPHTQR